MPLHAYFYSLLVEETFIEPAHPLLQTTHLQPSTGKTADT